MKIDVAHLALSKDQKVLKLNTHSQISGGLYFTKEYLLDTWAKRFKTKKVYMWGTISHVSQSGGSIRVSGVKDSLEDAINALAAIHDRGRLREDIRGDLIFRSFGYRSVNVKIRPLLPGAATLYNKMRKEGKPQLEIHREMLKARNCVPANITYERTAQVAKIAKSVFDQMLERGDEQYASAVQRVEPHLLAERREVVRTAVAPMSL